VLDCSNASTHVSKEKGIMASIRTYAAWAAAFLLEAIEAAATDDAERSLPDGEPCGATGHFEPHVR
jgi:hypothetical protein